MPTESAKFLFVRNVKYYMVMRMKGKSLLMAFVMGFVFPGLIFSVAEKWYIHTDQKIFAESSPTEHIEEQTKPQQSVGYKIDVRNTSSAIVTMDLNTYVAGVLLGELPADFDVETMKAQAVVARTYALKRQSTAQKHSGAVCMESACCQAYCGIDDYLAKGGKQETVDKVTSAVNATAYQILTYQNQLIEATYFSCSGGRTEDAVAVWGAEIPYLQAVDSPGEEQATHYTDSVQFSKQEFANLLHISPKGQPATWFGKVTYTNGGGVDTIVIAGKTFQGTDLRKLLGLRSTAFTVTAIGDSVHIVTKGFGHRVGMSQYGAEAMAVRGENYVQILSHYYPGTELKDYTQN